MVEDTIGRRPRIRILIDSDRWKETRYAHDRSGRIVSEEDTEGNKVQFTYKGNEGVIASVTTAEGITVHFIYDAVGRCMSVTDEMGTTEYAYNPMDRVTREADPLGNTTEYFYDMLCNVIKVVRPNQ